MPFLLKRGGANMPTEVQRWQFFLRERGFAEVGAVDADFGPSTEAATRGFQLQFGLPPTGSLDAPTLDAAAAAGYMVVPDDHYARLSVAGFPPVPAALASRSNAFRNDRFGCFTYVLQPLPGRSPDREAIAITAACGEAAGSWEDANIVRQVVPELTPFAARVRAHRLAAPRVAALFAAWRAEGLMHLVISWAGAFVARYQRGLSDEHVPPQGHGPRASSDSPLLSNHAFGTAFDINAGQNGFGASPAAMGEKGCVRELVPAATRLGFFWGGHFSRPDGMHFELANL